MGATISRITRNVAIKKDGPTITMDCVYSLGDKKKYDFTPDRVNKQKVAFEKTLTDGKSAESENPITP